MFIDAEKTEYMLSFLEDEHFRYKRDPEAMPGENEIDFGHDVAVVVSAQASPLIDRMEKDFRTFLDVCMGVKCVAPEKASPTITFALDGSVDGSGRDESFSVSTTDDGVVVKAGTERGLLRASHYIEKQFALRMAPFLTKGASEKKPLFNPRLSQTAFGATDGNIDNPKMLTDDYMSLMSHFGVNGIHIYVRLWDYCLNSHLPELNTPDYDKNIAKLHDLSSRAANYGIDIYLVVRTECFDEDDPVYVNHPEARGPALNFPIPKTRYSLCSSSSEVIGCYKEAFSNLVSRIPTLGGVLLLVGGEGFIHCFTRPKPPLVDGTSCPHCSGRDPSEVVAGMVNAIGEGVKSASKDAMVFAWPYSAFTWLGQAVDADAEFLKMLSDDISVLSNFDNPYEFKLGDHSAMLLDYNIVNIGPSELFDAQTKTLDEKNAPHYAKFEATTEPGWFFLPYLPIPYRWAERARSMRDNKVRGYVCQWRFYGFNGSLPEEILDEMSWNDKVSIDDLLMRIARRDFGSVSDGILEGWKMLSDTWPKIPTSHLLFGERNYYLKGPVYLGPTHPLIFDAQKRYDLGKKFFTVRGDLAEMVSPEEMAELEKNAPPRYSSDLIFTHPYGVEAVEEGYDSVLRDWTSGVSLIEEAIGDSPTRRAEMELDVCRTIGMHLRTVRNVCRFYRVRDAFFTSPGTPQTLDDVVSSLTEIINDEIENAKNALQIVQRDARIGYGHCYGQVYDSEMLMDKIRQCEYVRDEELPDLITGMKFHLYQEYKP